MSQQQGWLAKAFEQASRKHQTLSQDKPPISTDSQKLFNSQQDEDFWSNVDQITSEYYANNGSQTAQASQKLEEHVQSQEYTEKSAPVQAEPLQEAATEQQDVDMPEAQASVGSPILGDAIMDYDEEIVAPVAVQANEKQQQQASTSRKESMPEPPAVYEDDEEDYDYDKLQRILQPVIVHDNQQSFISTQIFPEAVPLVKAEIKPAAQEKIQPPTPAKVVPVAVSAPSTSTQSNKSSSSALVPKLAIDAELLEDEPLIPVTQKVVKQAPSASIQQQAKVTVKEEKKQSSPPQQDNKVQLKARMRTPKKKKIKTKPMLEEDIQSFPSQEDAVKPVPTTTTTAPIPVTPSKATSRYVIPATPKKVEKQTTAASLESIPAPSNVNIPQEKIIVQKESEQQQLSDLTDSQQQLLNNEDLNTAIESLEKEEEEEDPQQIFANDLKSPERRVRDAYGFFGITTFQRGQRYQLDGHVLEIKDCVICDSPKLVRIEGKCFGQQVEPYLQEVVITPFGKIVQATCNCPVKVNCKHCCAILLQYYEYKRKDLPLDQQTTLAKRLQSTLQELEVWKRKCADLERQLANSKSSNNNEKRGVKRKLNMDNDDDEERKAKRQRLEQAKQNQRKVKDLQYFEINSEGADGSIGVGFVQFE